MNTAAFRNNKNSLCLICDKQQMWAEGKIRFCRLSGHWSASCSGLCQTLTAGRNKSTHSDPWQKQQMWASVLWLCYLWMLPCPEIVHALRIKRFIIIPFLAWLWMWYETMRHQVSTNIKRDLLYFVPTHDFVQTQVKRSFVTRRCAQWRDTHGGRIVLHVDCCVTHVTCGQTWD